MKAERDAAKKRKADELAEAEEAEKKAAAERNDKEAAKANKKKKQEEKKQARIADAAEKKEFKQRKAAATKIANKLTPPIRNLQGALADPNIHHVPAFTLSSAKEILAKCLAIFEEGNRKKAEEKPAEISVGMAAVDSLHKAGMQIAKDVNEALCLVIKFRSRGAE